MKNTTNRLYWKISATLLVLLAALGLVYVLITGYTGRQYLQEVNQRLYGSIADSTVQVVKPLVDGKVDTIAIQDIMHSMMVINPSAEVYLLDTEGKIITYVAPNKRVKLKRVNLKPIKTFINSKEKPFIKGDDPRHPGEQKVFSAAPIKEEGALTGYLYIILASEEQVAVTETLSNSYMLKLGTQLFFLILAGAMIIGLLAIWYLTKNLRAIIFSVKRFKEGDYKARVSEKDKGDLTLLADTFNDMADTINANIDQLKSVENLRRELVANVSHDLRTPLAIMQGYVETLLMKEEKLSKKERKRYLEIVLKSTERLSKLVSQLFEYSKLEAKQVEPKKEPFFINELAQDIIQKYQILANEKEINIELNAPANLPMVFADVGLVERVIQNLLDNALKFTPSKGRIHLDLIKMNETVEVTVKDDGPGIPEQEQSFIFERYKKAGISNRSSMEGSGLGLAIVKKILELHESSIRVKSQLNKGTAFIFRLPAYVG